MTATEKVLTPEKFADAFSGLFEAEAFRVERLAEYDDDPGTRDLVARHAAGEDVAGEGRDGWLALVRDAADAGRVIARVHVVGEMTPYLDYELASYEVNAAAGETIAILPEGDADRLGVPPVDFWLFDRATVAVIDYDERGAPRAIIVTDDPVRAAGARQVRDLAVRHAIPLGDYKAGRKAA